MVFQTVEARFAHLWTGQNPSYQGFAIRLKRYQKNKNAGIGLARKPTPAFLVQPRVAVPLI